MLKEFREFALKGNVVDLAVGIVIGAAFGAIVNSLVADIIMPVVGLATGGVDFSQRFLLLKEGIAARSLCHGRRGQSRPARSRSTSASSSTSSSTS